MMKKLSKTLRELDAILANFEKDMIEFDKSMKDFDSIMSDLDKVFGQPHPDQSNRINMDDLLELDQTPWDQ